jgi:hypothetical protein
MLPKRYSSGAEQAIENGSSIGAQYPNGRNQNEK